LTSAAQAPSDWHHQTLAVGDGQKTFALADLDGDGHRDLLVGVQDRGQVVVIPNRAGQLRSHPDAWHRFDVGANPTAISVADLNGDDWQDLAVANHDYQQVTLLLSEGSSLRFARRTIAVAAEPHPHWLRLHDFDRDGHAEMLVDDRDSEGLLLLAGGAELAWENTFKVPMGGQPYLGFALADTNGDGRMDLITPNRQQIAIAHHVEGLQFSQPQHLPAQSPFAVAAADFNSDGAIDLVSASEQSVVQVWLASASGQWSEPTNYPVSAGAKQIALGHFDQEPGIDIVVSNWNGTLTLLLNGSLVQSYQPPLKTLWGLAAGDIVDGDGLDEIIVGSEADDRVIILTPNRS